jgi:hypothetical protein
VRLAIGKIKGSLDNGRCSPHSPTGLSAVYACFTNDRFGR